MDLLILDTNLNVVSVVDTYESLIWTDRYDQYGDFELVLPITDGIFTHLKQDNYIVNRKSEHLMIIEKLLVKSDVERGNYLTISGRSLESLLMRRIVWGRQTLSGTLQNGVKALLDAAIINPSDSKRKISNFVFQTTTNEAITSLQLSAQYTGDNLYDVVHEICSERNLGFKIVLNANNQFVFSLYAGEDRSYNQFKNHYVVFSPQFDNLVNSNYVESKSTLTNVALVGGEGEGSERRYASTGIDISGVDRRELFVDARDISSSVDEETLSDSEYNALLVQRGNENLAEHTAISSFEGEVDAVTVYVYGEDFYTGDVVQIANEYGHETTARVIEVVISESGEGQTVYPTFKTA